jgi:hypothetical protein
VKALAVALALLAALLAGCGGVSETSAPEPPATLAPGSLPELNEQARTLDAALLAADSFEPDALAVVLEEAGYLVGSEREFFGRGKTFDHVVARALSFEDAEGAAGYVEWVEAHAEDFLGLTDLEPPLGLGEAGVLFSLQRCDVCHKQQPAFLAAWREGGTVAFLLGAGPGVNRRTFDALARELDARIRA